jgi:hypothetical protein
MSYILNAEPKNSYLYITVTGANTHDNVVRYLSEVREMCLQYKCPNVLIVENLVGPSLKTLAIFDIASKNITESTRAIHKMAYVDINPEHHLDDMKFAENVATNRGLFVRIFSTIQAAEQWLAGQENSNP